MTPRGLDEGPVPELIAALHPTLARCYQLGDYNPFTTSTKVGNLTPQQTRISLNEGVTEPNSTTQNKSLDNTIKLKLYFCTQP